jgi:hypothetical protein
MLLHGESNILSQTTFPCRLKEIRSVLGKDASGCRVSHALISYPGSTSTNERSDIGELADIPFYFVPAKLE